MRGIVIPFRGAERGKSRLRAVLSEAERAHLASAMFLHVLRIAVAVGGARHVLVATPSETAAEAACAAGADVIPDAAESLNDALADACVELKARGVEQVSIIAADLPLLTRGDVLALLEVPSNCAGIAPDRHGRGTNALTVPAGVGFRFLFGEDSIQAHYNEAERLDLDVMALRRPGLAVDIDQAADLTLLPEAFGLDPLQRWHAGRRSGIAR
jgi:2-phospho-L-lactate/phosphoenolpyruvate guanylyltransferase